MPKSPRKDDATLVAEYMQALEHPLKAEIEALRVIIKTADPHIQERIKWNAPSYHVKGQDFLTFNLRMHDKVHLIFHHAAIVNIVSPLLQGDYKDRRMVYFADRQSVESQADNFSRIINELIVYF